MIFPSLEWAYKDISLCFDCAQHGALNVQSRSLSEKDISAPLNVRERSLRRSLSGVEVKSKWSRSEVEVNTSRSGVEGHKKDISAPLNVRSRSLSGAEVNSSRSEH